MEFRIYHNPRCSKSRATLELLQEQRHQPEVIRYLDEPPTVPELDEILQMLGASPRELMRKKEAEYKAAGLDNPDLDRQTQLELMVANPQVIERPIVVKNGRAAIGRPPEAVLQIL